MHGLLGSTLGNPILQDMYEGAQDTWCKTKPQVCFEVSIRGASDETRSLMGV